MIKIIFDPAHHRGAGQVSATVADIVKVLAPPRSGMQREASGVDEAKTQAPRSSLGDLLINRGPCIHGSGRGKRRLAATSSSCLALFVV